MQTEEPKNTAEEEKEKKLNVYITLIFNILIFSDRLHAFRELCDDNTNSSSFLNQNPPTSVCHTCA